MNSLSMSVYALCEKKVKKNIKRRLGQIAVVSNICSLAYVVTLHALI